MDHDSLTGRAGFQEHLLGGECPPGGRGPDRERRRGVRQFGDRLQPPCLSSTMPIES